jgi:hypothetical protein
MPSQEAPTGRTFLQEGWFIFFGDMDAPTEHPTNNQCGTWLKFLELQATMIFLLEDFQSISYICVVLF